MPASPNGKATNEKQFKVCDLAKEIGTTPLALMVKIAGLNLPIKNYSKSDPQDNQTAKERQ